MNLTFKEKIELSQLLLCWTFHSYKHNKHNLYVILEKSPYYSNFGINLTSEEFCKTKTGMKWFNKVFKYILEEYTNNRPLFFDFLQRVGANITKIEQLLNK